MREQADLLQYFSIGEIEVSQHKAGHWCKMTFLKEHISWDYLKMPSGQPGFHQFLHVSPPTDVFLQHYLYAFGYLPHLHIN